VKFEIAVSAEQIILKLIQRAPGFLGRILSSQQKDSLNTFPPQERALMFAVADLRALADGSTTELNITSDEIRLSHRLAASLNADSANALGLPPDCDLIFRTDAEGVIGSTSFRLRHEWVKSGQKQMPRRTGSILYTGDGMRRLPLWLLEAVEVAEGFVPGAIDSVHWEALARFRQALDPGVQLVGDSRAARVSMTDFLSSLEVRLADSFSISPKGVDDFDVIPFSGRRLESAGLDPDAGEVPESYGELEGLNLRSFQSRVRDRGALPAYRLSPGSYLVIDRAAAPALEVMSEMQRAPAQERLEFIRNPRPLITAAVVEALRSQGQLDGLDSQAEEEAIEAVAGPLFVETQEFSERVTGVTVYEKLVLDLTDGNGTTWLPEDFGWQLSQALASSPTQDLVDLRDRLLLAISQNESTVDWFDLQLPARTEMVKVIDVHLSKTDELPPTETDEIEEVAGGPIILESKVNFDELNWKAKHVPRNACVSTDLPSAIRTSLKEHQISSFEWQIKAWEAGLPGILNADEQGLGKTLQTIAFLVWLKNHMAKAEARHRGPVLVVAPTSLLQNWELEVSQHVDEGGLGHLIRLYGSAIGGRKITGTLGMDTDEGTAKLDFSSLHEAIAEGRAHRFWMLTTYTTLTNYQHSLGRIPFSAVVFDEIQALKNPVSLRARAARGINADFRIGLTGTPIENSATDLWAIMDQLAPGALDSLKEFRQRYAVPNPDNMIQLHSHTFMPDGKTPPLALRRIKDTVARDLPTKSRRMHPRLMPQLQSLAYDDARLKLAHGGKGAQLKMLHHIRGVSVHPAIDTAGDDADFINASGRLAATMEILRGVKEKGERALVFIEHRKMQYRFIELVRSEFGLNRVDLINGDTPIPQRQAIVNRFQEHLIDDHGFDLLVLGPKAAGTGLTLTAATHVIHLSRWWNPAVEEQCNDRVHRLGQMRPVTVHVPMAIHSGYRENSFDCLLHSLMNRKRQLASSALWPMGDTDGDTAELQSMLVADKPSSNGEPLAAAMAAMFARDGFELPSFKPDGSIHFD
jgi:superfamily II DNA or RNA helicase